MRHYIIIFIIFFTFFSCDKKENITNEFLFINAIENKIKELEKYNYKLHQFIVKDSLQDTLLIDSVEWKKEFSLFFDNAISKKQVNNYKLNETNNNKGFIKEFIAKDKKQNIRKLSYSQKLDSSFIYKVHVIKKNRLSEIDYHIEFDSNKGYLINSKQNLPYSYSTLFRIEGIFIQ